MKLYIGTLFLLISFQSNAWQHQILYPDSNVNASQSHFKKGYSFSFEAGFHVELRGSKKDKRFGNDPDNRINNALAVQISNSYRFSEILTIGLGAAFHNYEDFQSFPVFLDLKIFFAPQNKICPFLTMQTGIVLPATKYLESGYAYGTDVTHYNGFMINPNLGLRIGKNSAFTVSGGLMIYSRKENQTGYDYWTGIPFDRDSKIMEKFVTIRIGMMIN